MKNHHQDKYWLRFGARQSPHCCGIPQKQRQKHRLIKAGNVTRWPWECSVRHDTCPCQGVRSGLPFVISGGEKRVVDHIANLKDCGLFNVVRCFPKPRGRTELIRILANSVSWPDYLVLLHMLFHCLGNHRIKRSIDFGSIPCNTIQCLELALFETINVDI